MSRAASIDSVGISGRLQRGGDRRNMASNAGAHFVELTQCVNHRIDLLSICSFRVEDGLSVVKDDKHLPRGKEGPKGCQVFGVLSPRTNDLG